MDIQLFSSQESRSEIGFKATGYMTVFLLFINSFFGYWISLDDGKFAPEVSNWSSLKAAIIIFYIFVEALSVSTFLSIVYNWPKLLYGGSLLASILFVAGLTNIALRANGFCFFLLIATAMISVLLGYHYQCLTLCSLKDHHVNCRGGCKRSEDVHALDESMGGFLSRNMPSALTFLGAGVTSGATVEAQNANRHMAFTNEEDDDDAGKKNQPADGAQPNLEAGNSSTFRTQQHRRMPSSSSFLEVKAIDENNLERSSGSGKLEELKVDKLAK